MASLPPAYHPWRLFLLCLLPLSHVSFCRGEDFYKGTDVVELTDASFRTKVLEDHHIWMVEWYAPWCGHCQRLKPDYIKAATASKGIVRFGAINADEHKSIGGEYGIRGFPTLKIFGGNKKKPEDYNGARSAKAMADALIALLPNLVTVLKQDSYEKFFQKAPELPKAVLFTSKTSTSSLFKALALDLKDRMAFAEVRAKNKGGFLKEKGIKEEDLPVLLAFPVKVGGEGEGEGEVGEGGGGGGGEGEPVKYEGELKHKPLLKFLAKFALPKLDKKTKELKNELKKESKKESKKNVKGESESSKKKSTTSSASEQKPKSSEKKKGGLKEVKSQEDIKQYCTTGGGFCIFSLLKGGENVDQVDKLASLAAKFSKDPLRFVWADVIKYPKLKSVFLENDGAETETESYPIVGILNTKRKKFAVSKGFEDLEPMLDRVLGGDLQMSSKLSEGWDQVVDS